MTDKFPPVNPPFGSTSASALDGARVLDQGFRGGGSVCGSSNPTGSHKCNRASGHTGRCAVVVSGAVTRSWPHPQGEYPEFVRPVSEVDRLAAWWHERARDEIDRTVPKAIEYGSTDLVDIGRDLARCMGRTVTDQEAAELGIYFYIRGKLARWTDAVVRGEQVSDDSLFDIGVYARMAQRVRSHGGWPGTDNKEDAK